MPSVTEPIFKYDNSDYQGPDVDLYQLAAEIVEARTEQYGPPESMLQTVADFWSAALDVAITPHDVAVMLALLKMARLLLGAPDTDSYVDAINYLGFAHEQRYNRVPRLRMASWSGVPA